MESVLPKASPDVAGHKARAARYQRVMGPSLDAALTENRVELVRKYLASPGQWPDGIDWGSHWYRDNKAYWDALARGESVATPVASVASTSVASKNVATPVAGKKKAMTSTERSRLYRERMKAENEKPPS